MIGSIIILLIGLGVICWALWGTYTEWRDQRKGHLDSEDDMMMPPPPPDWNRNDK
jgi:hypothetical protein